MFAADTLGDILLLQKISSCHTHRCTLVANDLSCTHSTKISAMRVGRTFSRGEPIVDFS